MKTTYKLDCKQEYNFVVLGINSHSKAYKLCWSLNKISYLNFEKTDYHKINEDLFFSRYKSANNDGVIINLLSNRCLNGYMIPKQKSINYFLIISSDFWRVQKQDFLIRLKKIKDILLVFELNLFKELHSDRFIIYDKKN
tara:strand:+ start:2197 stop:2616 length:420 start_codon:yes stop_codon:yes gene_type:complete